MLLLSERDIAKSLAVAVCLLCALVWGCLSGVAQTKGEGFAVNDSAESGVIELDPEGKWQEPGDISLKNREIIAVSVPDDVDCVENDRAFPLDSGREVILPSKRIEMPQQGFSLDVVIDDVGYLDWYSGGSVSGYVESAKGKSSNSSWVTNVGGYDGVALVQGNAVEGGEMSGDVFVVLDEGVVWVSVLPMDGESVAPDAYSSFLRSDVVRGLLGRIVVTTS